MARTNTSNIYEGTYKSFLQGVSQQTPQEREDGQLGSQINMLSDAVTGLRRRGGVKYHAKLAGLNHTAYIRVVELGGELFIMAIDVVSGTLYVYKFDGTLIKTYQNNYLKAVGKASIRSTVSRDNCFILNTDKVPTKVTTGTTPALNPATTGYFSVRTGQFSKAYTVTVKTGSIDKSYTITTSASEAAKASPEYVASWLHSTIKADTDISTRFDLTLEGATVAFTGKAGVTNSTLVIESGAGFSYIATSGASRVAAKADLLGTLPSVLDGYIIAVGTTGNSAYFKYNAETRTWKESGVWEANYTITNMPIYWYMDGNTVKTGNLDLAARLAGDDDNNPLPKFVGYGITGIGAYQSRLVLLSGSYVNMSRTTEFNQFMRTSVTELLDDDAIEVSSASLSSAQFEYAIPYNKDLVLIAQNQQAVIPANSTVLTPKNAVIYPSTKVELSLAAEPSVLSRSLYYAYQRGTEYYQVGEFIPNSYTDAQYYSQNLTDHIPLYAKGVCTGIAGSTTNNMAIFSSDTRELLINQFIWSGDDRALMSFHKWVLPYNVVHIHFTQEFVVLFMDVGTDVVVGTLNVQLNQLDNKPVPFLDMYQYVDIANGEGNIPSYFPADKEFVAAIYDHQTMRHKMVQFEVVGNKIKCPYNGRIYIGLPYTSEFTLTPPFLKDEQGKVIAGMDTTINSLRMTLKHTGSFRYSVQDVYGEVYDGEASALTWSEVDLGYTWVNSVSDAILPCRTRLSSTECIIQTDSTTDLNVISTSYLVRIKAKHRRL